jgi:thioredoxin-related protein
MFKKALLFGFIWAAVLLPAIAYTQQPTALQPDSEGSLVKWMGLEEAMEKEKTQPKPIIIDFYTSWCGWCKQMMRTTYANPDWAQYINANFYPVRFNAETKDTIEYLGQKYGPVSNGRSATNALALKLLQNKLMYPTTLFLNNFDKQKNEFVFSMMAQGYLDNAKFAPILIFTLENAFRNSSYDDFKAGYDMAFADTATERKLKALTWLSPVQALNNKATANKKTMVLIHTDWCNGCKVMMRSSFIADTAAEKYLNDKYNLVDFNPEITDAITYKGQTYTNARTPQAPFHQLAITLCRNSFTLPTLVILDENMNIIDAVPFYLNAESLKRIATYYGDDIYKNKTWNDYMAAVMKDKDKDKKDKKP